MDMPSIRLPTVAMVQLFCQIFGGSLGIAEFLLEELEEDLTHRTLQRHVRSIYEAILHGTVEFAGAKWDEAPDRLSHAVLKYALQSCSVGERDDLERINNYNMLNGTQRVDLLFRLCEDANTHVRKVKGFATKENPQVEIIYVGTDESKEKRHLWFVARYGNNSQYSFCLYRETEIQLDEKSRLRSWRPMAETIPELRKVLADRKQVAESISTRLSRELLPGLKQKLEVNPVPPPSAPAELPDVSKRFRSKTPSVAKSSSATTTTSPDSDTTPIVPKRELEPGALRFTCPPQAAPIPVPAANPPPPAAPVPKLVKASSGAKPAASTAGAAPTASAPSVKSGATSSPAAVPKVLPITALKSAPGKAMSQADKEKDRPVDRSGFSVTPRAEKTFTSTTNGVRASAPADTNDPEYSDQKMKDLARTIESAKKSAVEKGKSTVDELKRPPAPTAAPAPPSKVAIAVAATERVDAALMTTTSTADPVGGKRRHSVDDNSVEAPAKRAKTEPVVAAAATATAPAPPVKFLRKKGAPFGDGGKFPGPSLVILDDPMDDDTPTPAKAPPKPVAVPQTAPARLGSVAPSTSAPTRPPAPTAPPAAPPTVKAQGATLAPATAPRPPAPSLTTITARPPPPVTTAKAPTLSVSSAPAAKPAPQVPSAVRPPTPATPTPPLKSAPVVLQPLRSAPSSGSGATPPAPARAGSGQPVAASANKSPSKASAVSLMVVTKDDLATKPVVGRPAPPKTQQPLPFPRSNSVAPAAPRPPGTASTPAATGVALQSHAAAKSTVKPPVIDLTDD